MSAVPFEVQVELLELIAEQEDFKKSAKALGVIGPEEIRNILRGIANVLRAAKETGAYEADESSVLSDQVKKTLDGLSDVDRARLFEAFGLGEDEG